MYHNIPEFKARATRAVNSFVRSIIILCEGMGNVVQPFACCQTRHAKDLLAFSADPNDRERQLALFSKLGFCILRSVLDEDSCNAIHDFSLDRFGHWCEYGTRFSSACNVWWQCSRFVDKAACNGDVHELTRLLTADKWGRYYCTKVGADVACSGVPDQTVHSDPAGLMELKYYWSDVKQSYKVWDPSWEPPCLMWSFALDDIHPDQAPIQIMPKESHFDWCTRHGYQPVPSCPIRLALPKGWAVCRDVRILHGGTANTHGVDRHMAGIVFCSVGMMAAGYGTDSVYRMNSRISAAEFMRLTCDPRSPFSHMNGCRLHYITNFSK